MADQVQRMTVTEVAVRLKRRYHKARDLMLTGQLGPAVYDGRRLTVLATEVEAFAHRRTAAAKTIAPSRAASRST